jgi:hypothetical protein
MKECPILFQGAMVRALLDGSKTQTRRVVKDLPPWDITEICSDAGGTGKWMPNGPSPSGRGMAAGHWRDCPYGQPGDRLVPAVPMPGYDKRYCLDVFGNAWSRAKGEWKRLSPGVTSNGYRSITPAHDGKYTTRALHQLVCEAFYGPAPDGLDQVRHLNGDQSDNSPENLDYGTQEQNWQDRAAHGCGMGERHRAAKLTAKDVAVIRSSSLPQRELAAQYGVTQSTIQSARVGAHWASDRKPAAPNMPRIASRILLEIVSVRVERLNDIGEDDAFDEGIQFINGRYTFNGGLHESRTAKESFRALWESINGAGSWDVNPFVWCVSFKRVAP